MYVDHAFSISDGNSVHGEQRHRATDKRYRSRRFSYRLWIRRHHHRLSCPTIVFFSNK